MRCLLKLRLCFVALAGLLLAACGTTGTYQVPASATGNYPPAVYAHRVGGTDVEIYWNCSQPEPGVVEMHGVVQNVGGRDVKFMELNLVGVGPGDSSVSQATVSLPAIDLGSYGNSPFHLQVRTIGSEARFDLYYQYYLGSGLSPLIRNFVRDACSQTQHLAH